MGGRQHGVVTWAEMRHAGLSETEIKRRIRKGLLIRQYRGVYRLGHAAPSVEASYMAAVKAGGGAVLAGRAAAYLHRILKSRKAPPPELRTRSKRQVPGLKTRTPVDPRDVTRVRGIPVTTVPATIVDLAAELDEDALARLCHEAGVLHGTTPRQVQQVIDRRTRVTGIAKLRRVMDGDAQAKLSIMEHRFPEVLAEARLPLPVMNKPADGRRIDARWPGLTVELNSYRFHNSRHSWEQDHEREREARRRGDEFRVFTYKDVAEDPTYMLDELTKLLRAVSPTAGTSARAPARSAARSRAAP